MASLIPIRERREKGSDALIRNLEENAIPESATGMEEDYDSSQAKAGVC